MRQKGFLKTQNLFSDPFTIDSLFKYNALDVVLEDCHATNPNTWKWYQLRVWRQKENELKTQFNYFVSFNVSIS